MSISDIRREYQREILDEAHAPADPMHLFGKWLNEAMSAEVPEATAMCLATVGEDMQPTARIVLLKDFDVLGFRFYTNYHSAKGRILEVNTRCSLTFFWPELERQIRIEGKAEKVKPEESDSYFQSRPRNSQLSAWASDQSDTLTSREELEMRWKETEKNFSGKEVFRPAHWGGYLVRPSSIEFWQGRESRLHDRLVYTCLSEGAWKLGRLSP